MFIEGFSGGSSLKFDAGAAVARFERLARSCEKAGIRRESLESYKHRSDRIREPGRSHLATIESL
jgi:hypothetical protein